MTEVAEASAAAGHAGLYRHAVVAQLLRQLSDEERSAPWLAEYESLAHLDCDHEIDQLEARTAERFPLARLDRRDALVLMAAGLIEADIRFGSLFAALQVPLASRRPCFGLLGWLLADRTTSGDVLERCQRLARAGLLVVDNPADPRSEWVARLPVAIWDLLDRGTITASSLPPSLTLRPAGSFPPLDEVVAPPELRASLPRIGGLLASGTVSTLVVRGPESSGRLTLLGSIARQLGRDVLVHEGSVDDEGWRLLGPLAALGGAMAVTVATPAPGETCRIPAFPPFGESDAKQPVTLGVVAGRHGGLAGPALEGALSLVLHSGDASDRRRLWLDGGLRAGQADLDEIVERFLLTPGNIRRAAPLAQAVAASQGRTEVVPSDVRAATGTLSRQVLETLATHLRPLDGVAPPVLAPVAAAELATLLALCRNRERLPGRAGAAISSTMNRGVRALFSGPSGTGKTLAARYVGAQLGLDVYRIDLAAVVSKYIGETERNLDQVLGRAEELDVVLLLDEGDALMTGRTEVGNANDRYANLETNFLLQRLETFEGIVVITSNASNRIDAAFQRRIDVTVEFLPPDADARHQIWAAHLPSDHAVSPQLLEEVARRCALTGGRIRNAVLHACLLALEGDRLVMDQDLISAIQREYRRIGATFPLVPQRLTILLGCPERHGPLLVPAEPGRVEQSGLARSRVGGRYH